MKKPRGPKRISFPQDEKRIAWLPLLLDALSVVDRGVERAIRETEGEKKTRLACTKGCDVCCRAQRDIPVYPLEMVGIYWYCIEKIQEPLRSRLRIQLEEYRGEAQCPFLLNHACTVHGLRPIACRQFNVFSRPCGEGEDPFFTRRGDVLSPLRNYTDEAFMIMLPFYGVTDKKAKAEMIRTGLIHRHARVLQSLDWKELAGRMKDFDSRR